MSGRPHQYSIPTFSTSYPSTTTRNSQTHLILIPGKNSSVINPTVLLARNEWKTLPVHWLTQGNFFFLLLLVMFLHFCLLCGIEHDLAG
ncbi:hypothetical protein VN97_g6089 [Penicillium thymicola]|uniref:Uncharacterized protein n=1 Tax=Penicillium thymicola TaxID=293382 RepID=A0AAI9TI68_PENTH|nr:hypothetical protein VN97_g6089 [Penicillium thymicola]